VLTVNSNIEELESEKRDLADGVVSLDSLRLELESILPATLDEVGGHSWEWQQLSEDCWWLSVEKEMLARDGAHGQREVECLLFQLDRVRQTVAELQAKLAIWRDSKANLYFASN
jgi:chromosome segregation ATPase